MARPHKIKPIISAESIKQMWDAKEQGKPEPPLKQILDLELKEQELAKDKKQLEEKVKKLESSLTTGPTALRAKLDEILLKHGINAAFEPLVELAMERYPLDHVSMSGQLVCSVDQRIKIWTELLSYQLPKLKAIEMAGQVDHSLTVVIRRFGDDALVERNVMPQAMDVPVTVKQIEEKSKVNIKKF